MKKIIYICYFCNKRLTMYQAHSLNINGKVKCCGVCKQNYINSINGGNK